MKLPTLALMVLLTASTAHGFPDRRASDDSDIAKDVEVFHGGVQTPYYSFLNSFSDVFDRMRRQMAELVASGFAGAAARSGDGNTTSVTKVIDGHKFTVNETVYSGGGNGDDAIAVFKVRVVDIRPVAEGGVETSPKEVEAVDSLENDIQKKSIQKRQDMENLETFSDEREVVDLSNDIYVNELAAAAGRPSHPDAEWIPNDLSNDIRVNELAAAAGWKPNPDAELLEEDGREEWTPEGDREHALEIDGPAERWDPSEPDDLDDAAVEKWMPASERKHAEEIEIFERYRGAGVRAPDLSGDTLVNELLQDAEMNPDAELLSHPPNARYRYESITERR